MQYCLKWQDLRPISQKSFQHYWIGVKELNLINNKAFYKQNIDLGDLIQMICSLYCVQFLQSSKRIVLDH